MAKLNRLTVKGFKSIRALEDFELQNLNVLIGANGAGKSNFIGIFRLLNNIYRQNLQNYIKTKGGVDTFFHFGRKNTEELFLKFEFGVNGYSCLLKPTDDNFLLIDTEMVSYHHTQKYDKPYTSIIGGDYYEAKIKEHNQKISEYVRNAIKSWKIYHFHDTSDTALVKRESGVGDNLILKEDGENLSAYLYMLNDKYPNEYQRIVDTIRLVLPFFDDFVQRENTELVELEWFQKGHFDTPLKAHLLSDGSLRFICLITLLLQPIELLPDTILIDEPELGLHPYAIAILADVIKQVAEDKQLIISTQSVELVNHFAANDIIVVNQTDGVSSFQRLDSEKLDVWLDEYNLGDLWKTNLIGGNP